MRFMCRRASLCTYGAQSLTQRELCISSGPDRLASCPTNRSSTGSQYSKKKVETRKNVPIRRTQQRASVNLHSTTLGSPKMGAPQATFKALSRVLLACCNTRCQSARRRRLVYPPSLVKEFCTVPHPCIAPTCTQAIRTQTDFAALLGRDLRAGPWPGAGSSLAHRIVPEVQVQFAAAAKEPRPEPGRSGSG